MVSGIAGGEYGGVVWGGLVRGLVVGGGGGACLGGCVLAESGAIWDEAMVLFVGY